MSSSNGGSRPPLSLAQAWLQPQVITLFFLGFAAGVPLLLIFSTLSVWLTEAGIDRSAVTFFSWAALGYSFKFIWAPIIDKMPLPGLTKKLGRRRSWLLLAQLCIIAAIIWMASINPVTGHYGLLSMACAAVLLGFSSASQDIVIDAYRIEAAPDFLQAMLASAYIAGYRLGMLTAGAGGLYLAGLLGSSITAYYYPAWRLTYLAMAGAMLIGIFTTLVIPEPQPNQQRQKPALPVSYYLRFFALFVLIAATFALSFFYSNQLLHEPLTHLTDTLLLSENLAAFFQEGSRLALALFAALTAAWLAICAGLADKAMFMETYVEPVENFFSRYGGKTAGLLLLLIGFYRISDIVLGVVSNVFYLDIGFSKEQIATITKTFGLLMTIAGGFLGGMLITRFRVISILFWGGFLSAATNLLFLLLARVGANIYLLTGVIAMDNLSAGLATTAFVAFLSSLTNIEFTAVQYALFTSLMTLLPKLLGGYSGTLVTTLGYDNFFLLTGLMGIPVLGLVLLTRKLLGDTSQPGRLDPPK